MKALIQRVSQASVNVEGSCVGSIEGGLLLLLGVEQGDTVEIAQKLLNKVLGYRVFEGGSGRMNLNVRDVEGGLLVISQFTLAANTKKGMRPSFSSAADPEQARALYDIFVEMALAEVGGDTGLAKVETGVFGADMKVALVNDGPVTFMLEAY